MRAASLKGTHIRLLQAQSVLLSLGELLRVGCRLLHVSHEMRQALLSTGPIPFCQVQSCL